MDPALHGPPQATLEFAKMTFPAVGALWAFYGVTLLGVLKQLQDPGRLLGWRRQARIGVLTGLAAFLAINLLAVLGMTEVFFVLAARVVDLPAYVSWRWLLIALHLVLDLGVVLAAYDALGLACARKTPA